MSLYYMLKKIIVVFLLIILIIFITLLYKTYEGFNNKYPQKKYKPSTNTPIPTALDGTSYMSPDSNGDCPSGFERDVTDEKSLCNSGCKEGKFYSNEDTVYGCLLLNTQYSQTEYSGSNYPFANDKKTTIISPTSEAKCPNNFKLDIKSGLCYTECPENQLFYGEIGCASLNTKFSQTRYDGSSNPYLIAEDKKTRFVSPTSTAKCPKNFIFDYPTGLCHTNCPSGTTFNGKTNSGNSIIGCT